MSATKVKTLNKSSKLLAFTAILALTSSAGCGLREAKQNQKIREAEAAAKRAHDLNKEFSQAAMDEAAKEARSDLESRVRYARALEGRYADQFVSISETDGTTYEGRIVISISPLNLPAPFDDERPIDATQIQNQMEAISFAVEIYEESVRNPDIRFFCLQPGVKPDYERGLLRVTCSGAMSAPSRDYLLALDDLSLDGLLTTAEDNVYSRSALASLALIEGRLASVTTLNVRISSPYGKIYRAKIGREDSDEEVNNGN